MAPVFLSGYFQGPRSLPGYSPRSLKELQSFSTGKNKVSQIWFNIPHGKWCDNRSLTDNRKPWCQRELDLTTDLILAELNYK